MVALIRSMTGQHPARPVLVLSDREDAAGLEKARALGVPAAPVPRTSYPDRAAFEAALQTALDGADADLLCLAGFMRILSAEFVARWEGRILNVHPSLLPRHSGLDTHARALAAGDAEAGCTVHEVTAALDAGPILGQARVRVEADDTPTSLAARVLAAEHRFYPAVLARVAAGDRSRLDL